MALFFERARTKKGLLEEVKEHFKSEKQKFNPIVGIVAPVLLKNLGKVEEFNLRSKILEKDQDFYEDFTEGKVFETGLEREIERAEKVLGDLNGLGSSSRGQNESVKHKIIYGLFQPLWEECNRKKYGGKVMEELFEEDWGEFLKKIGVSNVLKYVQSVESFNKSRKELGVEGFYRFLFLLLFLRDMAEALFKFSYYPRWADRVKGYLESFWNLEIGEIQFKPTAPGSWKCKDNIVYFVTFSSKEEFFSALGEEITHALEKKHGVGRGKLDRLFPKGKGLNRAKKFFEEEKDTIYLFVGEFFGAIGSLYVLEREGLDQEETMELFKGIPERIKPDVEIYLKEKTLRKIQEKYKEEFDYDKGAYKRHLLRKMKEHGVGEEEGLKILKTTRSEAKLRLIRGSFTLTCLKEEKAKTRSAALHLSQSKAASNYKFIKNIDPLLRRNLVKMPKIYTYFFIRFMPFEDFPSAIKEFSRDPVEFIKQPRRRITKLREMPEEVRKVLESEKFGDIVGKYDYLYFLDESLPELENIRESRFYRRILKEVKTRTGVDLTDYF